MLLLEGLGPIVVLSDYIMIRAFDIMVVFEIVCNLDTLADHLK